MDQTPWSAALNIRQLAQTGKIMCESYLNVPDLAGCSEWLRGVIQQVRCLPVLVAAPSNVADSTSASGAVSRYIKGVA